MRLMNNGCLKDPDDIRDVPLGAIQMPVAIPTAYKTDISMLPVDFQNGQPSCVGNAGSKLKEYQEHTDHKYVNISFRGLYALCKRYDNWKGDGTYLRMAMKVLQKHGAILESHFESDVSLSKEEFKDWKKIPTYAYDSALKYRTKTYASVPIEWDRIKQAIYQNKVVLGGVQGDNEGWKNAHVKIPKNVEWGHAIMFYGYDENYIYFRNSWGEKWGDKGIGFFDKLYLPYLMNPWTAVDMPYEEAKKLMRLIRLKGDKDTWACKDGKRDLVINKPTFEKGVKKGWWLGWDAVEEVSQEEFDKYEENDVIIIIPSD